MNVMLEQNWAEDKSVHWQNLEFEIKLNDGTTLMITKMIQN